MQVVLGSGEVRVGGLPGSGCGRVAEAAAHAAEVKAVGASGHGREAAAAASPRWNGRGGQWWERGKRRITRGDRVAVPTAAGDVRTAGRGFGFWFRVRSGVERVP